MVNARVRRPPAARSTVKPPAKGLNSYNQWSCLAMLEDEENQEDRLSNLPNHVLLDIMERLDIADAAKMSVLATRWKQLPAMLSKISLTVGSFYLQHHRLHLNNDAIVRANANVLEATRSLLGSRTTNLDTINLLRLQFFLGDGSVSICQTVANTMATVKVRSAELTLLTMKETVGCRVDDLLTYATQFKSLVDACPRTFSGLARLKLQNLRLDESGFPEVIGVCKQLEFLSLSNCSMGLLSFLQVSHPLLRELEIVHCWLERLDLKWLPKLTMLTFSSWFCCHDPLSFDYVPLLQTLSIAGVTVSWQWQKVLKLSEVLGKTSVSDLHLNFLCEKIWVKPEGPNQLRQVFRKLRHVTLTHISEDCDLNWTLFILQGAPSLQELCIKVWDHPCEIITDEVQRKAMMFSEDKKDACAEWEAPASDFKHQSLSVLRVFGFQCEEKFVNYIKNIMEASAALKDIYLYEKPVCDKCEHVMQKDRYPRTSKQRDALRSIFDRGMCSLLNIHFPSSIRT